MVKSFRPGCQNCCAFYVSTGTLWTLDVYSRTIQGFFLRNGAWSKLFFTWPVEQLQDLFLIFFWYSVNWDRHGSQRCILRIRGILLGFEKIRMWWNSFRFQKSPQKNGSTEGRYSWCFGKWRKMKKRRDSCWKELKLSAQKGCAFNKGIVLKEIQKYFHSVKYKVNWNLWRSGFPIKLNILFKGNKQQSLVSTIGLKHLNVNWSSAVAKRNTDVPYWTVSKNLNNKENC